eukprot:3956956-Prymnesium_polylepis.2
MTTGMFGLPSSSLQCQPHAQSQSLINPQFSYTNRCRSACDEPSHMPPMISAPIPAFPVLPQTLEMKARVCRIGEGSTLFALAVAVFSDLQMAFVGDVHELKEQLRLYAEIDESTHSLRLSELDSPGHPDRGLEREEQIRAHEAR